MDSVEGVRQNFHCLLLYYITDRKQFPGNEAEQRRRLLEKIRDAAQAGVQLIQLRERDLSARELYELAREAVNIVHETSPRRTKLLINSRIDVALAARADGVHLRSDDIAASEARAIWYSAPREGGQLPSLASAAINAPVIGVSCHSASEVLAAESHGADFVVFGPVFGKQNSNSAPVGIERLREVCAGRAGSDSRLEAAFASKMPVLALGSITVQNARACIDAGAAGIAAIRLFQDNNIAEITAALQLG